MSPSGIRQGRGFTAIFENNAGFVWRTLKRLGVRAVDVPDVCQEVFVVVYRRLDDFDGSSPLRSWIYGICARVASQYRRRAPQLREVNAERLLDRAVPSTQEEIADRRKALERLDRVLSRLDEEKREVFVLYEIEELSMKEVAAALECPLQTAYSRLHAARQEVEHAFRRFSRERSVG